MNVLNPGLPFAREHTGLVYDPVMTSDPSDLAHDATPPGLILLGGGGHARVLIDVARLMGRTVAAVLDDNDTLHGSAVDGVEVAGGIDTLSRYAPRGYELVNAVGSAGLPAVRRRVWERGSGAGFNFATLAHRSAVIASGAVLRAGAQVLAGAVVGPGAAIGPDAIINTSASVDHDTTIGAHTHIAPGATVCGGVTIGAGCHVGCGATIIQGVTIGDGVLVAAGAVVTGDLQDGARVAGVPAGPFPGGRS